MSLKSSNDDEAVDTGTRDSALAFSGYIGKHVTSPSLYRLVVTFAQRFYYSAYPVLACYWHFPLLDISRYCLLHNVSYTRHIQWQALLAFLLKQTITRHFNYSTFQHYHLGQGAGFHQACSTFSRRLLDVCSMFARSCKRGIILRWSAVP